jgi:hypothetical protein
VKVDLVMCLRRVLERITEVIERNLASECGLSCINLFFLLFLIRLLVCGNLNHEGTRSL